MEKLREEETCDCCECIKSDDPCHFDCDREAECVGCREGREAAEEIAFDSRIGI